MQARVQAQGEEMRGRLAAMGLDQRAIENVLSYMQIAARTQTPYQVGPSPYEENLKRLRPSRVPLAT